MKPFTHQVRLENGTIGDVTTTLKAPELTGRVAMVTYELDGETVKQSGIVAHVFTQGELEL